MSETYKNITWFKLINQIAPIITPASFMEPFREFLQLTRANGKKLFLGQSLPRAFWKVKILLTEHVKKGLAYYNGKYRDRSRTTATSKIERFAIIVNGFQTCTDRRRSITYEINTGKSLNTFIRVPVPRNSCLSTIIEKIWR